MKPFIEHIDFSEAQSSYRYLKLEVSSLDPYWHYHPQIEISYVKEGSGIRFVGDHIAAFTPGDLLLIGENLPHDLLSENQGPGDHKEVHVIQFNKELLQDLPECHGLLPLIEEARLGLHYTRPAPGLLHSIENFGKLNKLDAFITLLKLLTCLATDPQRNALSTISYQEQFVNDRNTARIGQVNAYIIRHFDQQISLDEIAKVAGLSPHSFTRWFRQSFSSSFVTYLKQIRVEKACRYLLHTTWQISDIAYRTGFESISNFNRTFKALKKMSPTAYRKRRYGE
ncbi:MAG: AraC family transcriptional regulator [Bacteroidetes bacterium]|nr:MAG: AraC family transcriptional regulator [Bacteroidota bacterium]